MKNPLKRRKNWLRINIAHFSMLYAVNPQQAEADAEKVFTRGYRWVTGTEAGEDPVQGALRRAAHKYGYTFHVYKSNWIAVDKKVIVKGSYKERTKTMVDNDKVKGPGHDPNVVWVRFKDKDLGVVKVMCSHYPTKGRPTGKGIYRRNLKWTKMLGRLISKLGQRLGVKGAFVFYGGDQNIVDRVSNTFFSNDMLSFWDELKKYENTGHGNIDVIARKVPDDRVKPRFIRALDDKELRFNSDHFPVEAGADVRVK